MNAIRRAQYAAAFTQKYGSNFTVQESFLRRELPILNNTSSYEFKYLQGDVTATAVENLLNKNDVFEITSIGMFLTPSVTASLGAEVLYTYPNIIGFPDVAGPPAFTSRHLYVFYNASLAYVVGTNTYVQSLDTNRFLYIPQTQKSSATNWDMQDLEQDARIELEPSLALNGANDSKFVLTAPYFSGIAVESQTVGTVNKLVLSLRGFLIKGAAQAKTVA